MAQQNIDVHRQKLMWTFGLIIISSAAVVCGAIDDELQPKYVFVTGAHHSSTSLMALLLRTHPDITGLHHTGVVENEGQHLQHVYPPAKELGGMLQYGFNDTAYLRGSGTRDMPANEATRASLLSSWEPYWDLSKPVLVEKSPRHVIMTTWLQNVFGESNSYFIILLRHPLGASSYYWHREPRNIQRTCGCKLIEHWLRLYEALREDVPHLLHKRLYHMETWLQGDIDEVMEDVREFLGLETRFSHVPRKVKRRRRLLEFHGNRNHVTVQQGGEFSWVQQYLELTENMTIPACKCLKKQNIESRLRKFGYSVNDLKRVQPELLNEW